MRVRPVDADGDMMPITDSSQMLEGASAVAQIARDRLLFYQGEWWEDETLGIKLPEFLIEGTRHNEASMLAKYISSYLSETPGATGLSGAIYDFGKRHFAYRAVLKTEEGSARLEVDLSGLL